MNVDYLNKEMQAFIKDKEFIETHIPDQTFNGIFKIDLRKYKEQLLDIIYDCIGELALKMEKNLKKTIKKDSVVYQQVSQRLARKANKIQEFIDLQKFINGKELQEHKNNLRANGHTATKLLKSLEQFKVKFDQEIYQLYKFSKVWISDIVNVCKERQNDLSENEETFKL